MCCSVVLSYRDVCNETPAWFYTLLDRGTSVPIKVARVNITFAIILCHNLTMVLFAMILKYISVCVKFVCKLQKQFQVYIFFKPLSIAWYPCYDNCVHIMNYPETPFIFILPTMRYEI